MLPCGLLNMQCGFQLLHMTFRSLSPLSHLPTEQSIERTQEDIATAKLQLEEARRIKRNKQGARLLSRPLAHQLFSRSLCERPLPRLGAVTQLRLNAIPFRV
jgi:hypothetical protein